MARPAVNPRWPNAPIAGLLYVKNAERSAVGIRIALPVTNTTSATGVGGTLFRLKSTLTAKRPNHEIKSQAEHSLV
jgi:hypothetical protein